MKTRVTSLVLMFVFAAFAVTAQQPGRFNQMDNERSQRSRHARNMGDKSFFTVEQKEEMKAIRLQGQKESKAFKDELRELAAHHKTLSTAEKADLNAINSSIDKMAEVKADLAKIKAKNHQKVRSILTEEQLLKMDARKGKRGQKPALRHGKERGEQRKNMRSFERG